MYDTRKKSSLRTKTDNTVYFGSKSISLLTGKIQKLVPESIKNKKSLLSSKRKIKFWTADKCNWQMKSVKDTTNKKIHLNVHRSYYHLIWTLFKSVLVIVDFKFAVIFYCFFSKLVLHCFCCYLDLIGFVFFVNMSCSFF